MINYIRKSKKIAESPSVPIYKTRKIHTLNEGHLLFEFNNKEIDNALDLINICKKLKIEVDVIEA